MSKSAKGLVDVIASTPVVPTFLEIIIDETTSMVPVKAQTIASFNQFIEDQKTATGTCLVTMTKFSTSKISTPYEMVELSLVPNLTANTYLPNGGTNLYDVILQRMAKLNATLAGISCNVIFLVLTDGEDTSSRSRPNDVRLAIGDKMETQGWTFVYLGAHQGAIRAALNMGFPEGNIKAFSKTEQDIAMAMNVTSNATTAYRSMRDSGVIAASTTSVNYFNGDQ